MRSIAILSFAILLAITACAQKTFRIEVQIDGLKDTTLLLGYHFGEKKFVSDTVQVNSKGVAVFEADSLIQGGLYIVVLPDHRYFDILIGDNQQFSLRTTEEDPIKSLTFKGSPENKSFHEYQNFMEEMQREMNQMRKELQEISDSPEKEEAILKRMEELDGNVNAYWDKLIEKHEGDLIANFVRALRPIVIPEFDIPEDAPNRDSLIWAKSYHYNQNHYFDNIDLTDARLLRTPILHGRIDTYFDRVLLQIPDTLIKYSTMVIEKTRPSPRMFQFMVSHLFSKFQASNIMGMDGVFVYLADNYYLSGDAHWASEELLGKIKERVENLRPNLIGAIAPNVNMANMHGQPVELHSINAKVTIVYFWEPTCSHCKKVTPELLKIREKYKERGVEVYAVYTQGDQPAWMEYVEKNGMNWINVWDPYRHTNYHKLYDIYSTPVIYILDKEKRIIAKRIGIESLERFLEEEL